MYHMTRGCDESSRLMSEPVASSSAPNLTVDLDTPSVEVRPTTYGSIETTVMSSDTEPLLNDTEDLNPTNENPKV